VHLFTKTIYAVMRLSMMRKLVLMALAGITMTAVSAQVQFGLKTGANFANLVGKDVSGTSTLLNFNGAMLLKIPVNSQFSVQPEVVFGGQGAKTAANPSVPNIPASQHLFYINVPVLFKYTAASGFFAETGPQLGFLISAKEKTEGLTLDLNGDYKSTDFAWVFGMGYLMKGGFGFDVRYNLGLTSIAEPVNGISPTVKNSVFQVGIMYLFHRDSD
jgi:outer membrane protein with beta-barrel domain